MIKKIKLFIFTLIAFNIFLLNASHAACPAADTCPTGKINCIRAFIATTGGASGAMDKVSYECLKNNDPAIVIISADEACFYRYNSTSSTAELGAGCDATVVKPDDNSGNGRWIRTNLKGLNLEDFDLDQLKNVAAMTESQGDILYHNGATWTRLGAGTSGQYLQTQGASANPQWSTINTNSINQLNSDVTVTDAGDGYITFTEDGAEAVRITGGNFGIGTTTPDSRLHIELDDASNSSVTYPYRLTHTTSGTPAAGIGAGIEFEVETSANNNEVGAVIEVVTTDVTATLEEFDLIFKTMSAGASASEKMRINSKGDVQVAGNIKRVPTSNFLPTRIASITLSSGENGGTAVAVSGRYAYVVTNTSPGKLVVIDISVPTAPTKIAVLTLNTGENAVRGLYVSGKYAYISTGASPSQVVIVDISNPVSPVRMGGLTLNSGENDARGIAIVGKYAYVVTYTVPSRVISLDISNPTLPVRLNSVTMNSGESNGAAIAVSGDYAFITTDTGTQGKIISIDISNPYALARLDDVALTWGVERDHRQIVISGRYAYVPSDIAPTSVTVVDIENPSNLVRTGGVVLASDEIYNSALAVAGQYVYTLGVTGAAGGTSAIQVIDVTNPAAPVRLGRTMLASGETTGRSMAISGRYIYAATYDSPFKFVVLDMGGAEISSMMAHSLEADSLMVRGNITVYDHLKVKGGLNVGEPAYLPEVATGKIQVNSKLSVPQAVSTPVVSSCGTSPSIIGNDFAGKITVGTGTVNACTITFVNAFLTNAPSCVVSGTSTSLLYVSAQSTTAITIGCTTCEGTTINYHCIGVE